MATAPRPGRVREHGPDELSVTIKIDDAAFTLYPELMTAADSRAFRAQAGMSVRRAVELSQDDPDIDLIAALVWVARCQAGEKVDLDEVAGEINYQSSFDVAEATEPIPDDHPSS